MIDHRQPGSPDWAEFRRQMPVARRWAYFDHAAVCPLPEPTRKAIVRWAEDACLEGATEWSQWHQRVEQTRGQAALLLGAHPAEIALVRNTTEGISLVAEGFPWQAGDNVVTLADEFPSNQYPWMNLAARGVQTRRVPVDAGRADPERIAAACDARTRIVAVSWVSYASGWRNDLRLLAEIAHRHGALLFVDAIQALGVFPLDVRSTAVDFLAADGHKWLLGPEGAGLLFVRQEHIERLRPTGVGWHSVVHARDFARIEIALKPSAERFEGGTENMVGMIGLGESLRLLGRYGTENLSRRIIEITDLTCRRLEQLGAEVLSDRRAEHASGIVQFDLPGADPVAVQKVCLGQQVVLSCRAGKLRVAPHAYNDPADVERLIEALERARQSCPKSPPPAGRGAG